MEIHAYITQKKQSLIDSNKKLSDDKLRVEGAWMIIQEIEDVCRGVLHTPNEEDKNHPVSEIHCHPSTEGNKPKTKTRKTKQGAK